MGDKLPAWQDNKSVQERNQYMLDNEIATDVCFEIQSSEGALTLVRAHKYVLVSCSPVFEAMLCGGMAEARPDHGNIKIEDIDATTFKEMLSYMYSEKAEITMSTVSSLLYAAKKYLLSGLVSECIKMLEKSITVDTVCEVLQQCVLFEEELKKKVLNFVYFTAAVVFNTEGFLHLSRDVLEIVADLDPLACTERCLFESCVKWARHQLRESGSENPSDEDIREALGGVLYKIRFPAMTPKEFAELTAHSKILTGDEKHDVYVYLATKMKLDSLPFATSKRCLRNANIVRRFEACNSMRDCGITAHAIDIQATVGLWLNGVGLYGGEQGATHDVVLMVLKGPEKLHQSVVRRSITSDGSKTPIVIGFARPVYIIANNRYTVWVSMRGPKTWSGDEGVGSSQFSSGDGHYIAFHNCERHPNRNSSNTRVGQIPELYCVTREYPRAPGTPGHFPFPSSRE